MTIVMEKIRELSSDWIELLKTILISLMAIYLCLEIGQLFFDKCLTPSCAVTTKDVPSRVMSFFVVMLLELVAVAVLALVLTILYSTMMVIYYSALAVFAIAVAIVAIAVIIGMIYFTYMMFRDYGFWAGIGTIVFAMGMIGAFGRSTGGFIASSFSGGGGGGGYDPFKDGDINDDPVLKQMRNDQLELQAQAQVLEDQRHEHKYDPNPHL